MKKIMFLFLSISALILLSCGTNDPTTGGGDDTGTGDGTVVGKFTIPKGGLSVEEQAKDLDPNDTAQTLFKKGDYGSQYFRIPALITTSKGTILAGTDRRYVSTGDVGADTGRNVDVIIRRSEDLGNTWGAPIVINGVDSSAGPGYKDSYGDLFFINTHSGDIICGVINDPGFLGGQPANTTLLRSSDDGKNWRVIFTFKSNDTAFFPNIIGGGVGVNATSRGFAASGRGITITRGTYAQGNNKSLAFGYYSNNPAKTVMIMSDDDGATWHAEGYAANVDELDETKLIDLADGTIMFSHRRSAGVGKRSWSKWNGTEAAYQGTDPEIQDPGNNADFVRYELPKFAQANGRAVYTPIKGNKTVLMIQSDSPAKDRPDAWFYARFNHKVHMTINDFNDGQGNSTGKYEYSKHLVNNGATLHSGYPAITVLPDGSIATLAEETRDSSESDAYDIVFRRFNLNWLTAGAEKVTYEEPAFQNQ